MKAIRDLSDWELARALMSHLNNRYSVGGISMGRSKQSFWLDMILSMLELTAEWYNMDEDKLIAEARSRKKIAHVQLLPGFVEMQIQHIDITYLYIFIIQEIWQHYEAVMYDDHGLRHPFGEWYILEALMTLLDVKAVLTQFNQVRTNFTRDKIKAEMRDRLFEKTSPRNWFEVGMT